ncbi:MAG: MGMT family protein, partial [bacterium]|nr:MGMT family protein [bacterium]
VGTVLKSNFDPGIPCHRVIRSDGKTGGYNRGADRKVELLRQEHGLDE